MFDSVLRRFMDEAPVCVAARATLGRLLRPQWLDELFRSEARQQYESKLLFSTLVGLMGQVVAGVRRSLHEAYQHTQEAGVSIASVYNKLNGLEPAVSVALVRQSAAEVRAVLEHLPVAEPPLEGYELRVVDGNHLAATEHRIKELRGTRSGPLPGQALVVLDPRRRLMLDVVPCEDGHAQERSLMAAMLGLVGPGELWLGDRNFCTTTTVCGIPRRGAFLLIRQHASTLTWREGGAWRGRGRTDTGRVCEQPALVWDPPAGAWTPLRRIRLELDKPTRDGEREILLLTNLPPEAASAAEVADLYGGRWQIEGAFGELTAALRCEVKTLGYPRAALFAFCLALLAYNAVSLVKTALAAAHAKARGTMPRASRARREAEEGISFYQLSRELAATAAGMEVAVDPAAWVDFSRMTPRRFARALLGLARRMDPRRYRKHPRGPKKKRPPQKHGRRIKHVSTAKLIARRYTGSAGP